MEILWKNIIKLPITFYFTSILLLSVHGLKAPKDIKVHQIWPGQVQVVWSYENSRNVMFTVHFKPVGESGVWESKTLFEQTVVVLEGLRAHTNYTVKVAALKGNHVEMSENNYVLVREGVPWSPTNLVFYKDNTTSSSYNLNWKTWDMGNVDGYLIMVAYENETVAIKTSHSSYKFDGVLPENVQYKIQVYAFNTVGRSEPAVVIVRPSTAIHVDDEDPEYQPEYPQETLLYVLIPIGVVLVAALILLIIILLIRRRRENVDDSAIYDEIPSQEPFFQPKNLANQTNSNGAQTRNCGVQVSGDVPRDRVLNYAIITQNSSQNDLSIPRTNGYCTSSQLTLQNDCETPRQKVRLKKSDSISSYTRYDDVDTDCEDYIHNSTDDVLQTSHLDMPKTSVRFSPHLDDRKVLSRRIPIFPIENERFYCVVDIDRYKLPPNNLTEQERFSPVY